MKGGGGHDHAHGDSHKTQGNQVCYLFIPAQKLLEWRIEDRDKLKSKQCLNAGKHHAALFEQMSQGLLGRGRRICRRFVSHDSQRKSLASALSILFYASFEQMLRGGRAVSSYDLESLPFDAVVKDEKLFDLFQHGTAQLF